MSVSDHLPRPPAGTRSRLKRSVAVLETPVVMSILGTLAWTLLILAAFADLFTTAYGLEMGAREMNPVGRSLLAGHGLAGIVLSKLVVIGIVAAGSLGTYAVERRYRDGRAVWWLYYPVLAAPIWMGAAAWNALQVTGMIG